LLDEDRDERFTLPLLEDEREDLFTAPLLEEDRELLLTAPRLEELLLELLMEPLLEGARLDERMALELRDELLIRVRRFGLTVRLLMFDRIADLDRMVLERDRMVELVEPIDEPVDRMEERERIVFTLPLSLIRASLLVRPVLLRTVTPSRPVTDLFLLSMRVPRVIPLDLASFLTRVLRVVPLDVSPDDLTVRVLRTEFPP